VLQEIHSQRDAYCAEHGNDLARIFADLKLVEDISRLPKMRPAVPIKAS
jgi:hypothetical protein